jgi:hypothetical protein
VLNRITIDSDIASKKMFRLRIIGLAEDLPDKDLATSRHREYPQKHDQYECARQQVRRSVCFCHLQKN